MKLPGMLSGAMSPSKRFLPSMVSERLMWRPLPAWSGRGLGRKLEWKPLLAATARTICLNRKMLSAVLRGPA